MVIDNKKISEGLFTLRPTKVASTVHLLLLSPCQVFIFLFASYLPLLYESYNTSLSTSSPSCESHCSSAAARMMAVGVSYVSLLNAAACHCGVPLVSYLWELGGDGALLARVELVIPRAGMHRLTESVFFWDVASGPYDCSHERAAFQAVRFP